MKHTVSYHIRYLLREEGHIYVPGIGMFRLDFKSAYIDANRQTIHPPALNLNFKSKTSDDGQLIERIASKEQISMLIADREVTSYSDYIVDQLLQDNKATIEGLGTLQRRGGSVTFTPAKQSIKPEYDWLQSIKLEPINRLKRKAIAAIDLKPKKELKVDYMPIVIGFVIGLVLISLWSLFCNISSDTKVEAIPNEVIEQVESVDDLSSPPSDETYHLNSFDQEIPAGGECIIITGSLTKFKNVIEMEALINDKGYSFYSENYHEMTRVGVKFDCTEVNLVDYIQEIRSEIAADAWYLDPELEVKY